MTLEEIKQAVDSGKLVYWMNKGYVVKKDRNGEYIIVYTPNDYTVGLTWQDGVTMNGEEQDFFMEDD